ncbi:hypothetical protein [Gynurincola endophyticus]|jgi:hypothetical protein|uniref:hypothetical protein n=1 Tax=Gynurincola endophyticus TaxID=2479004 RepID=UPI000F8E7C64|nr:hypothetical protein [Gynurincola endophyticus]
MIFPLIVFTILSIAAIHLLMKKQKYKLSIGKISAIFLYKLAIGSLYGYVFSKYFGHDDTWFIHNGGLEQTHLIKNDLKHFLYQLTPSYSWEKAGNSLKDFFPRWLSDMEWNLLRKPLGILNFFTGGNYYVNLTYINFLSFWGLFWIYQLFIQNFPNSGKILLGIIFFLPTTAFWLSGLRSEAFLIFFFGLFLKLVQNKKKYWSAAAAWLVIAIFRADFAFVLIPLWYSWVWWLRDQRQLKRKLLITYAVFISAITLLSLILPGGYPWQFIVQKQAAFFKLTGSSVSLTPLSAEFPYWLKAFPQALVNTYLKPFLNEAEGVFQLSMSLSQLLVAGAAVMYLFMYRKPSICPPYDLKARAWLYHLVIWSITLYLIVGLIVPFPGAIIRYKIIGELMLICCVAVSWKSRISPQIKTYYKK